MDRIDLDRMYQADLNRAVERQTEISCDVCERTDAEGALLSVWFVRDGDDVLICDDCRETDPETTDESA